jgi:hypothetical protein
VNPPSMIPDSLMRALILGAETTRPSRTIARTLPMLEPVASPEGGFGSGSAAG